MALRLKARYTLTIAAFIVAIVAVLSTVLLHEFRASTRAITAQATATAADDLFAQMQKRATLLATQLGDNLVNPLYLHKMDNIRALLRVTAQEEDVLAVLVTDPNGNVFHDGTATIDGYGKPAPHRELALAALQAPEPLARREGDRIVVAYGILLGDEPLGGVVLALSLQHLEKGIGSMTSELVRLSEDGIRQNAIIVAVLTITLIGIGAVLAYLVAQRLLRPIERIGVYAGQIGHGNYSVQLDIRRGDEIGDLANALEEMRDNLRRTSEEIHYLAYHDKLTGLPNRALFRDTFERAVGRAKRRGQKLAVLFVDVDDFKRINDTFGHQVGDAVLAGVAERMRASVRAEDYVLVAGDQAADAVAARLGGDEFIVLLPLAENSLDAAIVARRILASMADPIDVEGQTIHVQASIGIAVFPTDGENAADVLKNADIAMYHAKSDGKNRYKFFAEAMNQSLQQRMAVELDLRKALERDELILYYQPQVSLTDGRIVGAEALIRWRHPVRGLVPPIEFIPIAEETGLILPIGERVIQLAARQAREWRNALNPDFHVGVNVSSVQLRRQDVVEIVEKALRENGLEGAGLQVEITETNLFVAEEVVGPVLARLRALGVSVWMDDFGTGYSSLSHLRRFQMDGVKIDRSFVRAIDTNGDDQALARAIISMARSLHLGVIAEGIENPAQERMLRSHGCPQGQGYLYGKPMPAQDFFALLARRAVPEMAVSC